jgi:pyruvate/2-oxoglutarate dehydrogenase complex dihydrolipoamide acyltransferase (E2) component
MDPADTFAGPGPWSQAYRGGEAMTSEAVVRDAGHQPVPRMPRQISPYARRLAAQIGLRVADLVGTGPGGEIGAKDVRRAGALRMSDGTDRRVGAAEITLTIPGPQ